MTRTLLLSLPIGAVLHHTTLTAADGSPLRCRISGRPRLWKTRPNDFRVPAKHGLRTCFYITPANLSDWECPADRP